MDDSIVEKFIETALFVFIHSNAGIFDSEPDLIEFERFNFNLYRDFSALKSEFLCIRKEVH